MNDKAMATYRGLLVEIKYRVEAIDSVLRKRLQVRARIGEDLCYLQLRMICELLAMGCLVIHGELKPKADLYKTYKADFIIKEMEKLHPRFFPVALESTDTIKDRFEWVHKTSGFLTQKELVTLWSREAGARLHRGTVHNLFGKEPALNLRAVKAWRNKIVGLLNRHIIVSPDEKFICYFIMNDGSGKVASNLFEKLDADPIARLSKLKKI